MDLRIRKWHVPILPILLLAFVASAVFAQTTPVRQDTADVSSPRPHKNGGNGNGDGGTDDLSGDLILDEIEITGKVDKPGVIVMPKRVEPELGEIELERSFQKEMNEGIGDIPQLDAELGRVENVQSVKKTIEKKRK